MFQNTVYYDFDRLKSPWTTQRLWHIRIWRSKILKNCSINIFDSSYREKCKIKQGKINIEVKAILRNW
jgi:hypothetical protein